MSRAKTAEQIEMPFGMWTRMGPSKHWRHLANMIEPSMCGSDAALCHITLTTCLFFVPFFFTILH